MMRTSEEEKFIMYPFQYKIFVYGGIPYAIYCNGEIYNFNTKRKLSPFLSNSGYLRVGLGKAVYRKNFSVHRLVAELFVENPHNYDIVDHIDGNKTNNNYKNLRWVTQKINTVLAHKNGLIDYRKFRGENNHRAKLDWDTVNRIRDLYRNGYRICQISIIIFGNKEKKNTNIISLIVHNKRWII